jgi:hypothetical protein
VLGAHKHGVRGACDCADRKSCLAAPQVY